MSITVKLYSFSKRENSTKVPASTAGTSFDCILKEATSIINPTIKLQASDLSGYNYAYIPSFNRYYFISDIISESNNIWSVSLNIDALASWKSSIGASTQYVLRSSYTYDGDIIDNLYPTTGTTELIIGDYTTDAQKPFSTDNNTYVIGLINNNSANKFGAVQYYAMDSNSIGALMNYLLGVPEESSGIAEELLSIIAPMTNPTLQQAVLLAITNPQDYIVESFILPYKPPVASSEQPIKAGYFTIPGADVKGDILSANASEFFISEHTFNLPDHPQKNDRGPYLNLSPFMKYWLYLGPFGIYPIDSLTVYNARQIKYSIDGDILGNIHCSIFVDGKQVDILHANVKCNFPVAQTSIDLGASFSSGINTAASAVQTVAGDPSGIVSGISGIISSANAMLPTMRTGGSLGTLCNVYDKFYAYAEAHYVVDDYNTDRGRPLCKAKQISTIPGYILVSDADISIAGTREENDKIKSYMENGFFYE